MRLVDKAPAPNCWEWLGARYRNGYGMFAKFPGKPNCAHRVSWEIHNERTAGKGMVVCHKCDNRSCVNPDHLFLGTQQDNINDMWAKGRQPKGYKRRKQ